MYVAYPSRPMTSGWLRIAVICLRKFVSDPLVYGLAAEVALARLDLQHLVDAVRLVTIIEPFESMVVVAKPPIDRPVTQLVHLLA